MGTSFFIGQYFPFQGDHPHAYGDKAICSAYLHGGIGSSPRVWGQVLKPLYLQGLGGIIPTRMGTSIYHRKLMICIGDHPHAYGDKLQRYKLSVVFRGSSPRVWGQASCEGLFIFHIRIIPTRMGTRRIFVRLG